MSISDRANWGYDEWVLLDGSMTRDFWNFYHNDCPSELNKRFSVAPVGSIEEKIILQEMWNEYKKSNDTQGDVKVYDHAHPDYYTTGPKHSECGKVIECIDVSETFSGNLAQVIQYVWRHEKKENPVQDLKKARWFLDREIARREKMETEQ